MYCSNLDLGIEEVRQFQSPSSLGKMSLLPL